MDVLDLYYICSITATVTYLVAVVIIFSKKTIIPPYPILGLNLISLFSLDILFWIISLTSLVNYFNKNTLFSYHLTTLSNIIFYSFFFKTIFRDNGRKIFTWSIIGLLLLLIIDSFFLSTLKKINTYSSAILYIWVLIIIGISFERLVKKKRYSSIRKEPLFWIYLGILSSQTAYSVHNVSANKLIEYSSNSYLVMACVMYLIIILGNLLYMKGCNEIK